MINSFNNIFYCCINLLMFSRGDDTSILHFHHFYMFCYNLNGNLFKKFNFIFVYIQQKLVQSILLHTDFCYISESWFHSFPVMSLIQFLLWMSSFYLNHLPLSNKVHRKGMWENIGLTCLSCI